MKELIIGGGEIGYEISEQLACPVFKFNDIADFKGKVLDFFPHVETFFITTGKLFKKPFHSLTENEINEMFYSNVLLPIEITKILQNTYGNDITIVYFSSSVVKGLRKDYSVYSATKVALEEFAKNLKNETDINVKIVRPARTDTKLRWDNYSYNKENTKNLLSPNEVVSGIQKLLDSEKMILDIYKENELICEVLS